MKESDIQKETFRYERKFTVPYLDRQELDLVLLNNSYFFTEIFYERQVNNIYFDTLDMNSYFDNVLGNTDRTKIRIRWYGDLGKPIKPVLELKIKRGLVGTKVSYPLKNFSFPLTFEKIQKVFVESNLPEELVETLKIQRFSLINSYTRKYYRSLCKSFRITIDSDLSYYDAMNQNQLTFSSPIKDDFFILELKYDIDKSAENVSTQFPFRMTKSSKYTTGVTYFRGE